MADEVTRCSIEAAAEVVWSSKCVVRTPLIKVDSGKFGVSPDVQLYLKLEGMQNTGSFKLRGIVNTMANLSRTDKETSSGGLVTMSAGNYGRSFAYMCSELGVRAKVVMPLTAPQNRVDIIRSYGVDVEKLPSSEMMARVDRCVAEEGMEFMHPFDDPRLIAGHGSLGLEILEDLPDVDVVVVCCGGGGLLAGIAAALKLSGNEAKIFGVEPEGACTMYLSLKEGGAVSKPDAKSIAGGLAPPFAGKLTYSIVKQHVEKVVLVTDSEIIDAVRTLYQNGIVAEPSGAAALAALRCNKIGDVAGKKVVLTISGSNVSPVELSELLK